jgi:predicted nucleic acid-binding protein
LKYKGRTWFQDGHKKYKSLNSPDAIHLALALEYKCDEFWTADGDFDDVDDKIHVINILKPS